MLFLVCRFFCIFKQKTAYEMRISDWSSDVCSSDLTSTRTFTLVADEQSLELCFPALAWAFAAAAPHAHLIVDLLRRDSPDRFDRGEIDLLLSPDYILSKIHPSRHLFNSGWAIVAAADHDCYGPAPTLEQFRSARYVVREMRGNRFDFGSLDIAVHTPTYAMMISVIEGSSMLGVVPKRVGEKFAEKYGLKLLVHPDPPEDIRHLIQWHRHRIADTGVNWFRRLCIGLPVFGQLNDQPTNVGRMRSA